MAVIEFDEEKFRTAFPAFSCCDKYPSDLLLAYWNAGTCYVSNEDYGWLAGCCREQALELMTAHLLTVGTQAAAGQSPSVTTSATVGAVSVTSLPPPVGKSYFKYFLSSTPYGIRLLGLLNAKGVGGLYVGGLPEKSAFRKVAGTFGG